MLDPSRTRPRNSGPIPIAAPNVGAAKTEGCRPFMHTAETDRTNRKRKTASGSQKPTSRRNNRPAPEERSCAYTAPTLTNVVSEEEEEGRLARWRCSPQEDEERWQPDRFLLDGGPKSGCLLRHDFLRAFRARHEKRRVFGLICLRVGQQFTTKAYILVHTCSCMSVTASCGMFGWRKCPHLKKSIHKVASSRAYPLMGCGIR